MAGGVPRLRFEILGPVRVRRRGDELDLGPRQQRLILALLLARAGQPVGTEDLVTLLWRDRPPASAVNIVHRYIGGLRRLFEPDIRPRAAGQWLASDAGGYRMTVDAKNLDLLAFRSLAEQARVAAGTGKPDAAMTAYVEALGLWRGPCAGAPEQFTAFSAVDYEYADLAREAADLALRSNGARSILSTLRRVAEQHPFDESIQARLLLALSAVGQQAEAIALYQRLRRGLAEELGIDPGDELREAYQKVLRQQDSTTPVEKVEVTRSPGHYRQTLHDENQDPTPRIAAKPQNRPDRPANAIHIVISGDDIGTNGHVRSSKYLDYAVHARWAALAQAGLSIKELTAAGLGPVELDVSIRYFHELVLGDEIDVETRYEYPSPKIVRLVQSLVRHSDGVLAAEVTSVTGLMDLRERKLVENAADVWAKFLRDLSAVDLPDSLEGRVRDSMSPEAR
ncbi:BTAD domain-containing putative transcriptional regulator [Streptosporangium sp. G12]